MERNAVEIIDVSKTYTLLGKNFVDQVRNVFRLGRGKTLTEVRALQNINLSIKEGEIFGILGRNGSGKSTLLKVLSGITNPTTGQVKVNGKVVPLLELGGGFNPEYTGRENVYFYCSLIGYRKDEVDGLIDEIIDFSELEDFIDVPIKKYSSGMRARLNFAVSINIDPDILILDEVLAVGDELFKKKCFLKMQEIFNKGKTIIYVSHNIRQLKRICNRACIIHGGQILSVDEIDVATEKYKYYLTLDQKDDYHSIRKKIQNYRKRISSVKRKAVSLDKKITKMLDIDILDYSLKKKDKVVTTMNIGDTYTVSFLAKFNVECSHVTLGAVICDESNKEISSYYSPDLSHGIDLVQKGEILEYSRGLYCALSPGLYTIRLVVRVKYCEKNIPVSVVKKDFETRVKEKRKGTYRGPYRLFC